MHDPSGGEHRVTHAIEAALNSPLLNNNDIFNSKKVLLNICFNGEEGDGTLKMEEMNEVNDFMRRFGKKVEAKFGFETDSTLGGKVRVTLLASGFKLKRPEDCGDLIEEGSQSPDDMDEGRAKRREMYYPDGNGKPKRRHRFHCHVFTDSQLCDDTFIDMLADSPTHSRSSEESKRLAAYGAGAQGE